MRLASRSADETRAIAARLGEALGAVPRGGFVVSLAGDLGAGKTTFAQGLLRGLGVPPEVAVVSPTFVFARAYRGRAPVHHLDAYHVRGVSDLEASGFFEHLGEGRVTVVEWGDRIAESLPVDRLDVEIAAPSETEREIRLRAGGPVSARALERLREAVA
jgi:tRNA threonylcarbamoyladenosine biosynthesis protein TsaE